MIESISTIKAKLPELEFSMQSDYIKRLRSDSRKGVQQVIRAWEKKQQQAQESLLKLQEMKQFESEYLKAGYSRIAGVDEVGRGPLAGPVVAAAVILPNDFSVTGINDSKQLSEEKRQYYYDIIREQAVSIGISIQSHEVIDQVNIYEATKLAMAEALDNLDPAPDFTLIDAMKLGYSKQELAIIKGDTKSISIAAASIIAKVTRDSLMKEAEQLYPGYDFAHNMGYGTKLHLEGLDQQGVCPIHRLTFAPVKAANSRFQ